jgi:hypothetical protein
MHPAQTCTAFITSITLTTFRALVEAIVPNTPELAVLGAEQVYGAADLCIHEYMIWELDHSLSIVTGMKQSAMPLSASTAHMLNEGAIQLFLSGEAQGQPNWQIWPLSPFASLIPVDRIRVLVLLEEIKVDLLALPPPYTSAEWVRFMVGFLNSQTMFGNYSEWNAYGSTRLMTPTERRLQYFPVSWQQVRYPGVLPGYRLFMGYTLTIVRKGGTSTVVSN